LGVGTATVRQPVGAAPPEGAVLVVVAAVPEPAVPVLVVVLVLALLPQPAALRAMAARRHALRTAS
jgi:hypothetical protein